MRTYDGLSRDARPYFLMIGYMVEQNIAREGVIPERILFVADYPRRVRRELMSLGLIRKAVMPDGSPGFVHDVQRSAVEHLLPVRH